MDITFEPSHRRAVAARRCIAAPTRLYQVLLLWCLCFGLNANAVEANPVRKVGACPTGYQTSGGFCRPGRTALGALEKIGPCPSGYQTSGAYCLAGPRARRAIAKSGACPAGHATSGAYCLANPTRR